MNGVKQKSAPGRDQCPDQVKAPTLGGRAQADREEHESHDADSGEVVGEQRGRCESGEQYYRRPGPHGAT
jgi:hypothetical protein